MKILAVFVVFASSVLSINSDAPLDNSLKTELSHDDSLGHEGTAEPVDIDEITDDLVNPIATTTTTTTAIPVVEIDKKPLQKDSSLYVPIRPSSTLQSNSSQKYALPPLERQKDDTQRFFGSFLGFTTEPPHHMQGSHQTPSGSGYNHFQGAYTQHPPNNYNQFQEGSTADEFNKFREDYLQFPANNYNRYPGSYSTPIVNNYDKFQEGYSPTGNYNFQNGYMTAPPTYNKPPSYYKPPDQSYYKPPSNSYYKPPSNSYHKPSEQPYVKPSEQSYYKPSEQTYYKPPGQTYYKPSEQSYLKPSEQPYIKPSEQAYFKPSEQTYFKPSEQAYFKPSEQAYFKPSEQAYFKPSEQAYFKPSYATQVPPQTFYSNISNPNYPIYNKPTYYMDPNPIPSQGYNDKFPTKPPQGIIGGAWNAITNISGAIVNTILAPARYLLQAVTKKETAKNPMFLSNPNLEYKQPEPYVTKTFEMFKNYDTLPPESKTKVKYNNTESKV